MRKIVVLALGAFLVALAGRATPEAKAAPACDRACLEGLVNQYLTALVAHDPKQLPLAAKVKFTENTVPLSLGDGAWQTIDSVRSSSRIYIADPKNGQIAFYGAGTENGRGVFISVRLKEVGRRLTEIESFVVRDNQPAVRGAFDNPPEPDALWSQPLAPSERMSRADMIKTANQYPEGLVHNSGDIVPFEDSCTRWENGIQTAPQKATADRPAKNMHEQFNSMSYAYIHEVSPRRFAVVDEERGIVYALFLFEHPGNVISPENKEAAAKQYSLLSYPNSTMILESFKVRKGKIAAIYAYVMLQNYRQPTGW